MATNPAEDRAAAGQGPQAPPGKAAGPGHRHGLLKMPSWGTDILKFEVRKTGS